MPYVFSYTLLYLTFSITNSYLTSVWICSGEYLHGLVTESSYVLIIYGGMIEVSIQKSIHASYILPTCMCVSIMQIAA